MKYLIGFIAGVILTVLAYQWDQSEPVSLEDSSERVMETVSDQISEGISEIDYTFYEDLYQSSVTVIKDVYDAPLKAIANSENGETTQKYYVQIGAFSKQDNAEGFRGEAILEGYLSGDIFVESSDGVHRVMMGPFTEVSEANLAVNWAASRNFSGVLVAKRD